MKTRAFRICNYNEPMKQKEAGSDDFLNSEYYVYNAKFLLEKKCARFRKSKWVKTSFRLYDNTNLLIVRSRFDLS